MAGKSCYQISTNSADTRCELMKARYTFVLAQFFCVATQLFPYGLAVRIPGFHPGGPGSTPGMGSAFFFLRLIKFQLRNIVYLGGAPNEVFGIARLALKLQ